MPADLPSQSTVFIFSFRSTIYIYIHLFIQNMAKTGRHQIVTLTNSIKLIVLAEMSTITRPHTNIFANLLLVTVWDGHKNNKQQCLLLCFFFYFISVPLYNSAVSTVSQASQQVTFASAQHKLWTIFNVKTQTDTNAFSFQSYIVL